MTAEIYLYVILIAELVLPCKVSDAEILEEVRYINLFYIRILSELKVQEANYSLWQ